MALSPTQYQSFLHRLEVEHRNVAKDLEQYSLACVDASNKDLNKGVQELKLKTQLRFQIFAALCTREELIQHFVETNEALINEGIRGALKKATVEFNNN